MTSNCNHFDNVAVHEGKFSILYGKTSATSKRKRDENQADATFDDNDHKKYVVVEPSSLITAEYHENNTFDTTRSSIHGNSTNSNFSPANSNEDCIDLQLVIPGATRQYTGTSKESIQCQQQQSITSKVHVPIFTKTVSTGIHRVSLSPTPTFKSMKSPNSIVLNAEPVNVSINEETSQVNAETNGQNDGNLLPLAKSTNEFFALLQWEKMDLFFILIASFFTVSLIVASIFIGWKTKSARVATAFQPHNHNMILPDHIILPPKKYSSNSHAFMTTYETQHRDNNNNEHLNLFETKSSLITLRDVLNDNQRGFHLAMAPSFFGFYGYFGALDAFEIALGNEPLFHSSHTQKRVQSVAGSSAGAMAAVLLAAGIRPRVAAEFVSNIKLHQFADFPGYMAFFRGNKFEQLMYDFLKNHSVHATGTPIFQLQNAKIPIAITGFDVQSMKAYTIRKGSMARAARASATFPLLFQPVGWIDHDTNIDHVLIDGGITDPDGILGLQHTMKNDNNETMIVVDHHHQHHHHHQQQQPRVINLSIGKFYSSPPPMPSMLPGTPDVISISIQNLPQPGPWAMSKGPKAIDAARNAILASLDVPLFLSSSNEKNHFELHIDATAFTTS